MINILKKLAKIIKINYYKDSIRLIEKPRDYKYDSVTSSEITECIFSKERLISGKYHYIQKCTIVDLHPEYRCQFINIIDEDKVKSMILTSLPIILSNRLRSINITTNRLKGNKYLNRCKAITYEGDEFEEESIGNNYKDSKILLYYNIIKMINHFKYEHNKAKKK